VAASQHSPARQRCCQPEAISDLHSRDGTGFFPLLLAPCPQCRRREQPPSASQQASALACQWPSGKRPGRSTGLLALFEVPMGTVREWRSSAPQATARSPPSAGTPYRLTLRGTHRPVASSTGGGTPADVLSGTDPGKRGESVVSVADPESEKGSRSPQQCHDPAFSCHRLRYSLIPCELPLMVPGGW
jgi:hypothetical protein